MDIIRKNLYRVRFVSSESEFVIANDYSDVECIVRDGRINRGDEIVSIERAGKCYVEV